jgi:hypothetical protein
MEKLRTSSSWSYRNENELQLFKGDKKMKLGRRYSFLLKGLQEREHGFRFWFVYYKSIITARQLVSSLSVVGIGVLQAAFRETTHCTDVCPARTKPNETKWRNNPFASSLTFLFTDHLLVVVVLLPGPTVWAQLFHNRNKYHQPKPPNKCYHLTTTQRKNQGKGCGQLQKATGLWGDSACSTFQCSTSACSPRT